MTTPQTHYFTLEITCEYRIEEHQKQKLEGLFHFSSVQ